VTFPPGSPPYRAHLYAGQLYGFKLSGDPEAPPVVEQVTEDSAAARAGLRAGDRLTAVAGYPVDSVSRAYRTFERESIDREDIELMREGGGPVTLPARRRSLPVHPAQFYSTVNALVLCLLLLAYDRFRRRDGELTALMLTLYPVGRYLLERIRDDERVIGGTGLTISQNFSLVLLLGITALWLYVLRRPRGRAFAPSTDVE